MPLYLLKRGLDTGASSWITAAGVQGRAGGLELRAASFNTLIDRGQ